MNIQTTSIIGLVMFIDKLCSLDIHLSFRQQNYKIRNILYTILWSTVIFSEQVYALNEKEQAFFEAARTNDVQTIRTLNKEGVNLETSIKEYPEPITIDL